MKNLTQIRKRISQEYEKILLCFHEAAHAVIGLYNCLFIDKVETYYSKQIHGATFYIDYKNKNKKYASKFIQFFYAGLAAEMHHYYLSTGTKAFPYIFRKSSSSDFKQTSMIIAKFKIAKPYQRSAIKNQLFQDTYKIVKKQWNDISIVAHFLFKKKTATYQELQLLLTTKSKNKKLWINRFEIIEKIKVNNFKLNARLIRYSEI